MIQVLSCEQALTKTDRNPIENHHSFFSKRTQWNLSLTDISSTCLAIKECRVGFLCFLLANSALSRVIAKMTGWKSPIFHISPTTNIKIGHIGKECDHIRPFTNHKSALLRFWFIYEA